MLAADSRPADELLLSEERYRALIAAIAETVWVTDACGNVTADQPGWRAFTGQTSEEIQAGGWLAALHPDLREAAASDWLRAAALEMTYETEWRVRRRDGEYRWFSIRAAPVRTKNGIVREWIGCNIDITDQKRCDEELRRMHVEADTARTDLGQHVSQIRLLKNLSDTMQACNSRAEAYPFIALAAVELFPGTGGALAVCAAGVPDLLETATEWCKDLGMRGDFSIDDCWALRRGGMHEPGPGTVCHHFRSEPDGHYVCIPLFVRGEVSGLLSLRFAETRRLDEEGRSVLAMFGNAVALGLSTLQLRETLHERSMPGPIGLQPNATIAA